MATVLGITRGMTAKQMAEAILRVVGTATPTSSATTTLKKTLLL